MDNFIAAGTNILGCFPTRVFRAVVPNHRAINPAILRMLAEERARRPDARGRAIDGWRSLPDLFDRGVPAIDALAGYVRAAVGQLAIADAGEAITRHGVEIGLEMWANVMADGASGRLHHHMGNGVTTHSGVYYVDVERGDRSAPDNGLLQLVDPRNVPALCLPGQLDASTVRTVSIRPEDGLLVVLPAWLNHQVLPWRSGPSGAERTSLSFNAALRLTER